MITPDVFAFFKSLIEEETGIQYQATNAYQLEARLDALVRISESSDIQTLYDKVKKNLSEEFKQILLDVSTNNETSFFRDKNLFKLLEDRILPQTIKQRNGKAHLKIWSAASSYGQEAVSLAILLSELRSKGLKFSADIYASDISSQVLNKADLGLYNEYEVGRGLTPELLDKYFTNVNGNWKTNDSIRNAIHYFQHNLLAPIEFSGAFDIVFCRNVLIYQSNENKKQILSKIADILKNDGLLILGGGETLYGITDEYKSENIEGITIYRKRAFNPLLEVS